MINQAYAQMCIEQGAVTGEAGFSDVFLMCCMSGGWEH